MALLQIFYLHPFLEHFSILESYSKNVETRYQNEAQFILYLPLKHQMTYLGDVSFYCF
jgi:hypothetical protein